MERRLFKSLCAIVTLISFNWITPAITTAIFANVPIDPSVASELFFAIDSFTFITPQMLMMPILYTFRFANGIKMFSFPFKS